MSHHNYSMESEEFRNLVEQRFASWFESSLDFIKQYEEDTGNKNLLVLNEGILLHTAKSYYDDVFKYKHYSESDYTSDFKKASFTLKWISRHKPIQISVNDPKNITELELDINNLYALKCACSYIDGLNVQDLLNKSDLVDQIFYNLSYRDVCGKTYALTFELIQELLGIPNPNPA